ncbi:MAG: hypothetical protein P9L91_01170 [Candidatus Zophobacter franzmannii]|nr:hypothetical protein [Candidatus Zophobacter franzmannii]
MNKYSKVILLALIVSMSCGFLWAGNSIFSRYGFPIQNEGYDVYGMGMGNTGAGDFLRLNYGVGVNPALCANSNSVLISTGLKMGYTNYEDKSGNYNKDDSFDFPYFSIQVPIRRHHIAFQFTSFMSGNLSSQSSSTPTIDGVPYELETYETVYSYIYRADLMYAYRFKYLNVGIGANYYLGNRKMKFTQDYIGLGPDIGSNDVANGYDTFYEVSNTYANPGFMAGLGLKFKTMSMGLAYHSSVDLKNTREFKTILSSEVEEDESLILPHTINSGVTFKFNNTFKTNVDFRYEIWEESDFNDNPENSWRIGAGIAYEPISGEDKFYKRLPIRAGHSMRNLAYKVNNSNVIENTLTLGSSIPIKAISSRVDFAYQYSRRGDATENGVEETAHMFMIGISGFDIFQKTLKRDKPRDIPEAEDLY